MLSPDDVINLMWQNRRVLRKQAILARAPRTPFNQVPRVIRYLHEAARIAQNSSVWSLRRLSVSFRRTTSTYS